MSGDTLEPRLNIRYPDYEVIDQIVIDAHRIGFTKNAWVKEAIEEKLNRDRVNRILDKERQNGEFETRKLIQMMAGPDLTREAKEHVVDFIERVVSHAKTN